VAEEIVRAIAECVKEAKQEALAIYGSSFYIAPQPKSS